MLTFVLIRIFAVLLLVAANAFFAAGEYALVSIRDTRLQQLIDERRTGARIIRKLHNKLDEVLNGVQVGVTMASLGLGWIGEQSMAHLLELCFSRLPHAAIFAHTLSAILAFALITYMHVILGEVVPKSIALQKAERVALVIAPPMDLFITLISPVTRIMAASSSFVLRAFGWRHMREVGVHAPEELKLSVTASHRYGLISKQQQDLLHRALDLDTVTVREVMVPRQDIFSLPGDMPLYEAAARVVEEQHSRVPVYDPERGLEAIIGMLYAKDLMSWMQFRQRSPLPPSEAPRPGPFLAVRHIMRDAHVVAETTPLPDLLADLKSRRRHLAVVVDEFGSTVGIVSVEDVLEQLVGEIEDEYDVVTRTSHGNPASMVLEASLNIRDLESQFHLRLPRDEGFETLAGFVVSQLQRIPLPGDSFLYQQRRYTVMEMEGHRVSVVRVELVPEAAGSPAEGEDER